MPTASPCRHGFDVLNRPRRATRLRGAALSVLLAIPVLGAAQTPGSAPPRAPAGVPLSNPQTRAALADYDAGNFPAALQAFKQAAEHGNRLAQFDYAMMLLNGEGTPVDFNGSLYWLKKAASANMSHAQYAYARLYDEGKMVPLDPKLAHRWYIKAASQGHVQAEVALATQYIDGRGTPRDYAQAFRWYKKAALAGDMTSEYIVASYYERGGDGVTPNLAVARAWYEKAAAQGDPAAAGKVVEISGRLKKQHALPDSPHPSSAAAGA